MTKNIWVLLYVLVVSHCQTFKKVMIPDSNAVCLDGSPGAYYLADAGTNPRKFMIYFEGGGWCGAQDLPTTLESCYQRSSTDFGSSSKYPSSFTFGQGILSNNLKNYFHNFTKVYLKYCDGSGHQGTRSNPVLYKGKNLYFRGQNLTISALNHLEQTHGLFSKSVQILITGGSAGGTASMTWTNYIWDRAAVKNVYTIPDAGIFMDYVNFRTGQSEFRNIFMNIFKLSNVESNPPNPQCVNTYPSQPYKCMFAQYLYPFLKTIIFPVQSLYDSVALPVIVGANCINNHSLQSCTEEERNHIEEYHKQVQLFLAKIGENPGNGFWAPICVEHCFMLSYLYSPQYTIPMNSGNTIDATIRAWVEKKASGHKYIDSGVWPQNKPCS